MNGLRLMLDRLLRMQFANYMSNKLTGSRRRITHVKNNGPIRDAMSIRSLVSCLGISLTNSNNIFVPGPCKY